MLDSIDHAARKQCIGGSDAKIIMGDDQKALLQLWKVKRGEAQPDDLSGVLIVQMGSHLEGLNAEWFEREHPQYRVLARQSAVVHPKFSFMGCTPDGTVGTPESDVGVFEGKFMLPWAFDLESAVQKHWWQLQHNMMVMGLPKAFLSIITGGGGYFCKEVEASAMDQSVLLEAERTFWFCVKDNLEPVLVGATAPTIAPPAVKIVNMRKSNAWAMQAGIYLETQADHERHESAKKAIKELVPTDAKEARGHGICVKRSKSNSLTITEFAEEEVVDA